MQAPEGGPTQDDQDSDQNEGKKDRVYRDQEIRCDEA